MTYAQARDRAADERQSMFISTPTRYHHGDFKAGSDFGAKYVLESAEVKTIGEALIFFFEHWNTDEPKFRSEGYKQSKLALEAFEKLCAGVK